MTPTQKEQKLRNKKKKNTLVDGVMNLITGAPEISKDSKIEKLIEFFQKRFVEIEKRLGEQANILDDFKKTITSAIKDELEPITQGNEGYKKKIATLEADLKKKKKEVEDWEGALEVADRQKLEAENKRDQIKNHYDTLDKTLKQNIEKLKTVKSKTEQKEKVLFNFLLNDNERKNFIEEIKEEPKDFFDAIYNVFLLLESNLFIHEKFSDDDNASKVFDAKREMITLQIISAYLMAAINDEKITKEYGEKIIEFTNKASFKYEIKKPEPFFDDDYHQIKSGTSSPSGKLKYHSLPIQLKNSKARNLKIIKALVESV